MGGDVAIAQPEPLRLDAVGRELGLDGVGLAGAAPALSLVDATSEGVHHRVEVRAHPQAEQRDVVARVADDGDLGDPSDPSDLGGVARARGVAGPGAGVRVEMVDEATEEPGPTNPSGKDGDPHGKILSYTLSA